MIMQKFFWGVLAMTLFCLPLSAMDFTRRANISGRGGDHCRCTIEVVVDDAADVEIFGDMAILRTLRGQTSEWRRFECTDRLPRNPLDFRFRGIDGRGRQELIQYPSSNRGIAVVRIDDPKGGRDGYTFELEWRRGADDDRGDYYPEGRDRNRWEGHFPAGLRIVRASYGADRHYRDVTGYLQGMVRGGRLEIRVDNETLRMDPAPNRHKELQLTYEFRGRQRDVSVPEGDWLRLPEGGGREEIRHNELRIIKATYGAGGNFIDVANFLQEMVRGDRLNIRVDNETFQTDPARDRRKELRVIYVYNGQERAVSIPEGDRCVLP
jgi:hypothetical protein